MDWSAAMPLNWPQIRTEGGNLAEEFRPPITRLLDCLADEVRRLLEVDGLSRIASPLFRSWNIYVFLDSQNVIALFTTVQAGLQSVMWNDMGPREVELEELESLVERETGDRPVTRVVIPRTALLDTNSSEAVTAIALLHVEQVQRRGQFSKLGDLTGLEHLESALRTFLEVHPVPEKNVFVMMRFEQSDQLDSIHAAIRNALKERGFHAVRADDRNYTDELWSNIQVCISGCSLGIAVFEDINQRDFNPNVSLELGYMLGRRKRCLLLKEQRLNALPTDVIHRLYKPFDAFNIEGTIETQVLNWIDTDLGEAT